MSDQTPIPKASSKTRSIIGLVISVLWLALLGLVLFYFDADEMKKLRPNEWGDTLAGWFAPLALFWVVLGYLQQGDELKLNTQALLLQQKEMQEQSSTLKEQMMALSRQAQALESQVKVTQDEFERTQVKEREEIKPKFYSRGGFGSNDSMRITFDNRGGYAANIKLFGPDDLTMLSNPQNIDKGGSATITVHGTVRYPTYFKIRCDDLKGNIVEQEYVLFGLCKFVETDLYNPETHIP